MNDTLHTDEVARVRQSQQPIAAAATGLVAIGTPTPRIDALAKVTVLARYAAEHDDGELLYAVVVNTSVVRGRITAIDATEALAIPGVIDVLSHLNRPRMRSMGSERLRLTKYG